MVRRCGEDLNLLYSFDASGDLADEHGIRTLPLMMMIDGQGRIRHVHQGHGADKLDQIVDELNALMMERAKGQSVASPQSRGDGSD
jgi:hypothetical protein